MKFKNLKISKKLALSFSFIIIILICISSLTYFTLTTTIIESKEYARISNNLSKLYEIQNKFLLFEIVNGKQDNSLLNSSYNDLISHIALLQTELINTNNKSILSDILNKITEHKKLLEKNSIIDNTFYELKHLLTDNCDNQNLIILQLLNYFNSQVDEYIKIKQSLSIIKQISSTCNNILKFNPNIDNTEFFININSQLINTDKIEDILTQLLSNDDKRNLIKDFTSNHNLFTDTVSKLQINNKSHNEILISINNSLADIMHKLNTFIELYINREESLLKLQEINNNFSIILIECVSGIGILISILLSWILIKIIVNPIKTAIYTISTIVEGELSSSLSIDHSSDEIGHLMSLVESLNNELYSITSNISDIADIISTSSHDISNSSSNLTQQTEDQAASLEETSASLEEITGSIQQSSTNISLANVFIKNTSNVVSDGEQVVNLTHNAMQDISKTSKKMFKIIEVIDEIAFQINLLSLNASIEAARAGEQGRAFSVVANEIKRLAKNSAVAANDIKSLIEDNINKVNDGVTLTDKVYKLLSNISSEVKTFSGIIDDINLAVSEQSIGLEQINKAVLNIGQVTQHTAITANKTADISLDLEDQSNKLREHISFFKLS